MKRWRWDYYSVLNSLAHTSQAAWWYMCSWRVALASMYKNREGAQVGLETVRKQKGRWGGEFDLERGRHWRDHQIKWENRQWRGTSKITQRLSGEWRRSAPPGIVTGNTRRTVVLSEWFCKSSLPYNRHILVAGKKLYMKTSRAQRTTKRYCLHRGRFLSVENDFCWVLSTLS